MTTPDQPQDVEPDQVKVIFELERDEDGWPPVSGERLWAFDLRDGTYRIDNVPCYVRDLAVEDIVAAARDEDRLLFTAMVEKSQHLTIRLYCLTDHDLQAERASIVELFRGLGLYLERSGERLLALDIPPGSDLARIKNTLVVGEAEQRWDWEEGRINDEWREL